MSDENAMMPISATRREVAAQPEVVARVLSAWQVPIRQLARELARREVNGILAAGSGDSWFAAQAARLAFEWYAGLPMEPLQAYEYAAYGHPATGGNSAVIVISSSGRPTTTWDALNRALDSSAYVIGITDNSADSNPFATRPHTAIIPGASKVGWPAQTTTATIAVLIDLAINLGRARGHLSAETADRLDRALRELPERMRTVLSDGRAWSEELAPSLAGRRILTFVGAGPSYGVAQVGTALLAEGPQEVGVALTVEEFHHALRIATLAAGDPLLLVAPAGATGSRAHDTARAARAWGAQLIPLVTEGTKGLLSGEEHGLLLPQVEEPLSPLLTVLPLHLLSIDLAAQKVAGGYQRPESVP